MQSNKQTTSRNFEKWELLTKRNINIEQQIRIKRSRIRQLVYELGINEGQLDNSLPLAQREGIDSEESI